MRAYISNLDARTKAYIYLHISVLMWGFSAIFGALISLEAIGLVWWRVMLATSSLLIIRMFIKRRKTLLTRNNIKFLAIGGLVTIHWLTFFGSIKIANASVAVAALATTTFFTAFLEPWVFKTKVSPLEVLVGLGIIPGVLLLSKDLDGDMLTGMYMGLVSALTAAYFATLNKKYLEETTPINITILELGSTWILLSIVLLCMGSSVEAITPLDSDWLYLCLLAFLCTTFAFLLSLYALRQLTAFESNLIINLEPVYGVILAAVLLHENEELNLSFYLGVAIIVLLVFLFPLLKRKFKK